MDNQTILVDLDALMDTRLATVGIMDSDAAADVLRSGYWMRDDNDFETRSQGKVRNKAYMAAYAMRDVTTLKASFPTPMREFLHDATISLQDRAARGLDVDKIKIHINLYPYKLTKIERNTWVEVIKSFLALTAEVEAAYHPVAELTPGFLMERYDAYVCRDFDEWDTKHRAALVKNPIPMFTFFTPQWHASCQNPPESAFMFEGRVVNPFTIMSDGYRDLAIVEMLHAGWYSVINPDGSRPPLESAHSETNSA